MSPNVEHTLASSILPGRFAAPQAEVPMVQLIDPSGQQVRDPDFSSAYTPEQAIDLLEKMAKIRRFDLEGTALQRKGRLSLWAPLLGQEAVQVGTAAALGEADHVFPSHREHGVGMLMGVGPEKIFGVFSGAQMGDWDSDGLRFHHYSMVIGAHSLHAVGYAMAQSKDLASGVTDASGVSVIFHGDGAISEGDVNEAYAFAAVYNAPVVFVCVNNQWAISEPVARQSRIPLYQRAWGFGIPSLRVDGNDVLAVHAVVSRAIEAARAGNGPQMIEAYTYRMGAHTTSDDPTKYRGEPDDHEWMLKDPIARLQAWLTSHHVWDQARQARLDQQLEAFGETIRRAIDQVPPADLGAIFDHVYADPTPQLLDQQAEAVEYEELA